jgi:hypothetical protein
MFHHLLSEEGMYQPSHQESEEGLIVARCLRGEYTAWETMFHHYHPRLVSIIKVEMNCQCSTEQAEEIAASVWCSLCSEAYSRLRRYDPHAGRLLAYLAGLARREIWKKRREEQHRRSRESRAARMEATTDEAGRGLIVQEFLDTLSRREREFCLSDLMKQSRHPGRSDVSSTNRWKLRSRILKKCQTFILEDS